MAGVAFSFFAWSSGLGARRRPRGRGRAGGRGRGKGGRWERQPVVQLRRNPAQPSAAVLRLSALQSLAGVFSTRRRCDYTPRCRRKTTAGPLFALDCGKVGDAGAADSRAAPAPCPTSTVSVPESQSPPDCGRAFLEITGVSPLSRPKDSGYFPHICTSERDKVIPFAFLFPSFFLPAAAKTVAALRFNRRPVDVPAPL